MPILLNNFGRKVTRQETKIHFFPIYLTSTCVLHAKKQTQKSHLSLKGRQRGEGWPPAGFLTF